MSLSTHKTCKRLQNFPPAVNGSLRETGGARQSPSARDDLVEVMTIDAAEYLRFKPFPLDIVFLRGTTADEAGNVSMEQDAIFGEMLSTAQAARRAGGLVVVQGKRLARGALCRRRT